jgi:hypothetical protein
MLAEFGRYVPGIVGVIAPFVAAAATLLPPERVGAKWRLVIAGVVLGAISFGATAYLDSAKDTRRASTQNQLSLFIEEGTALLPRIFKDDAGVQSASDEWAKRVEGYLKTTLGDSYERRFRSEINIGLGIPVGIHMTSVPLYNGVRMRIAHLQQFFTEIK